MSCKTKKDFTYLHREIVNLNLRKANGLVAADGTHDDETAAQCEVIEARLKDSSSHGLPDDVHSSLRMLK